MPSPTSRRKVTHSCALLDPLNPRSYTLDRLAALLPALEAMARQSGAGARDARASPSPSGGVISPGRLGLVTLPDLTDVPTIYDDRVELVTIPIRRIPGRVTDAPITVHDFLQAQELIRALFLELALDDDQEHFLILTSDRRGRVYGFKHVASGARDSIVVDTSIVYRSALLLGAAAILAVHNHPSGDPVISEHDRLLTFRLHIAASFLDIQFLDHFIHVPDGRCHSIRAKYPDIWSK